MIDREKQRNKIRVIRAMLGDLEFLNGGIFQREKQYCKKYDLTEAEMVDIEIALHYALDGGICEKLDLIK